MTSAFNFEKIILKKIQLCDQTVAWSDFIAENMLYYCCLAHFFIDLDQ